MKSELSKTYKVKTENIKKMNEYLLKKQKKDANK
jgi:hypothetical protein